MEAGIFSAATYYPSEIRSPDELLFKYFGQEFGIAPDYIQRLTGIKTRHIAPLGALPSDLAIEAAKQALQGSPGELDAVLFAGMVRDRNEPSTASTIAAAIGSAAPMTWDIADACHGFGAAMITAEGLISSGKAKRVLITSGEMGSRVELGAIEALRQSATPSKRHFASYAASFTLGDGGGAVVMGDADLAPIRFTRTQALSDNTAHDICRIAGNHSPIDVDQPALTEVVRKLIWPAFQEFTEECCNKGETYYIVHQVSQRILREMIRLSGASASRFSDTVSSRGNLISVSFVAQLVELLPRLKQNDTIAVALTGSGVSASFMELGVQIINKMDNHNNGSCTSRCGDMEVDRSMASAATTS